MQSYIYRLKPRVTFDQKLLICSNLIFSLCLFVLIEKAPKITHLKF